VNELQEHDNKDNLTSNAASEFSKHIRRRCGVWSVECGFTQIHRGHLLPEQLLGRQHHNDSK